MHTTFPHQTVVYQVRKSQFSLTKYYIETINMILLIVLSVFLFLLLMPIYLHKRYVKKHEKYLKNVPGPKPNSFFGNMLDFVVPTHKFLNIIKNYCDNYGSIVKIYDGPQSTLLLVAEEKLVEHILSSTQIIEKSNQYDYMKNWLGNGLLLSTGSKWKKRRRLVTPAFHFGILENFAETFDKNGDIFIKKLESHVGRNSVDIYPLVTLCTLDVICEASMGTSVNAQMDNNSKYVKAIKELNKIITDRNFSPLDPSLYPLTINYYKELKAVKVVHSHTDSVINKRIQELNNKGTEETDDTDFGTKKKLAFLDLLLKSTVDGMPLSRADIREEVDTFMFEGHDTTSSAISFALYCLATNPKVQQKTVEEQEKIFGDLKTAKVTLQTLQEMKYLELVIKETLRLYPSVPMYARNVGEDFEWEGVLFPKDQQILLLPCICHKNPKYFPNPEEFIPERFLEMDGSNPYMYIPFSAGPRNCIGQKFAMFEMKSLLSKVLRNFELLPAIPECELQLAPEVILISKNGIHINLKKRH